MAHFTSSAVETYEFSPVFKWVRAAQTLEVCVVFYLSLFVFSSLSILAIIFSMILRYTPFITHLVS